MAGMKFEYDEKGGTFYYFLLSFLALVLVPLTYYLWPREEDKEKDRKDVRKCHCPPCEYKKEIIKKADPWRNSKRRLVKLGIIAGWIVCMYVAYKTTQVEIDWSEFDPFQELGIDRGSTDKAIKKAYRQLALIHHPDKETGDPNRFIRINKAYKVLTDEEAKKNWEEYGNPDGPGATNFGIALPKWIVEKQNSIWVLLSYLLVFIVILPTVVGTWWYRSIKYSADQILMDTTQVYGSFISRSPDMIIKRILVILGASLEFEKSHNAEIVARITDNEEVPMLLKSLPHIEDKKKERPPLGYPYAIKARALIHAQLNRTELPPNTLELDKQYVIKKCPYLLNEMVNIISQIVIMSKQGHARFRAPSLNTLDNVMKVSQMVVQGLWMTDSAMLQLPHISRDDLRHFTTRKRKIRSIKDFAEMKDEDRKSLVRHLSADQYRDVINVCANMPLIDVTVDVIVLDEREKDVVTAGALVTIKVFLKRQSMKVLFDKECEIFSMESEEDREEREDLERRRPQFTDESEEEEEEKEDEQKEEEKQEPDTPQKKAKVWEKQAKKKKGKATKKKPSKAAVVKKPAATTTIVPQETQVANGPSADTPKSEKSQRSGRGEGDDMSSDDEASDDEVTKVDDEIYENEMDYEAEEQQRKQKQIILGNKSKLSHIVHCPYFPEVKYEWWWLFIANKKENKLESIPMQVCSLKDEEKVDLKICAPQKPGLYQYTVILKSDSYMDLDVHVNFKLDVQKAKEEDYKKQFEDLSDEEEDHEHDHEEDDDETETETETDDD